MRKKDAVVSKSRANLVPEVKAVAKFIRQSPGKIRRVAKVVDHRPVGEALEILKRLPHKGAEVLYKVIKSAAANAEHNYKMNQDELVLNRILVNEGPRLKRFQPKAKGRIYKIIKRTSHIEIAVKAAGGK